VRRLYVHIYLTLLASLAALTLLFWLTRNVFEGSHEPPWAELARAVVTAVLPAGDASNAELGAALERLGGSTRLPLSLYSNHGELLASTRRIVPMPSYRSDTHSISRGSVALRLDDGRWIVAATHHGNATHLLLALALLGLLIAAASYPFVRRLTGRLERLRRRVDSLGAGNLAARVAVEGQDEIAALAQSFNHAADHIERLLRAQRDLLANASHELRSPLARIALAFELLAEDGRADLREQVGRDIAELDELIGELLLASRLQAVETIDRREPVDLLAVAAEEAAHVGATVAGDRIEIEGDAKLLRRLLRNLLENARRYGGGTAIEVTLRRDTNGEAALRVEDRGPGIPEVERERVFEPFYRRAGTAETGHGVGLGLALVRQIARRHGGEVRCLGRHGGGTCFEVVFPAATQVV